MARDFRLLVLGGLHACLIGLVVWLCVVLAYDAYVRWRYPCTRYEPHWQAAHTELLSIPDGNGGLLLMPVFHEAGWVQVCAARAGVISVPQIQLPR